MTATPKVFGDTVRQKADEVDAVLCSMDDEELYGKELFVLNFSEAVHLGLLSDYKVLVLAVEEEHVSKSVQRLLADSSNELKLDDATKIIGCWKALSKAGVKEGLEDDTNPMRRAVAFCKDIKKHAIALRALTQMQSTSTEQDGHQRTRKDLLRDLVHALT